MVLRLHEAMYAKEVEREKANDTSKSQSEEQGDGPMWLKKMRTRYTAAMTLNFLRLRVLNREDNVGPDDPDESKVTEARALRMWWLLSCVILKKKMLYKQRFRMVLEVAMFGT
jgi:hypothetical protein